MSGISSTGFETKTYNEIVDDKATRASSSDYFGEDFPVTPDSIFGILAGVYSGGEKDLWDLLEALSSQMDRDTASGYYLDRLAAYIGLTRLGVSSSNGDLLITATNGLSLSSGIGVKTAAGDTVETDEAITFTNLSANKVTLTIPTNLASTLHRITINGDVYSYTTTSSPNISNTTNVLINLINGAENPYYGAEAYSVAGKIVVYSKTSSNVLSVIPNSAFTITSVSDLVAATAVDTGAIYFYANTLNTLVTTVNGILSVTNPDDFIVGRDQETDNELRIRMQNREQITGTATKPSIEASISNLDGVNQVLIIENTTWTTDTDGRPPKSYEVYVDGGTNTDIANTIWETKPAGIETYGDITVVVTDSNNDEQAVNFSRYAQEYAWVEVTYQINNEETFLPNGVSLIKDAVVNAGGDMYAGEDFETTKFFGPIYSNVSGLYVTQIRIAVTENPEDTPTYQTTRISIDKFVNLLFDSDRVTTILSA